MLVELEVNYLKNQVGPIHACAYKVLILNLSFSLNPTQKIRLKGLKGESYTSPSYKEFIKKHISI
jgi:hypothetical protein